MKKVMTSVRIAFRALRVNRTRSALTMLGIIIGVAAVIAMVGVGAGATAAIFALLAAAPTASNIPALPPIVAPAPRTSPPAPIPSTTSSSTPTSSPTATPTATPTPSTSPTSPSATPTPSALRECLALGYGENGRVVKHRTLFLVGRTRVHLDRVQGLGHFLELEVVLADSESSEIGKLEAQELMERLGIGAHQLIEGAYVELLLEEGI